MKLNIECGNDLRNGYLNINSTVVSVDKLKEGVDFVIGDYRNISMIVADESAEEIVFAQPLNRLGPQEFVSVFQGWLKKLMVGGTMTLHFYDIRRIGRVAHLGDLSLQDIHNVVFGPRSEFKTVVDLSTVKSLVNDFGLTVESVSTQGLLVNVEVKK